MTASRKLRTAHFLMFIGAAPLALSATFIGAGIAYAKLHPGETGGSDVFLMLALALMGYGTTAVLGSTGALWSWYLTRRGIDASTTATVVLRTAVVVGVVGPLAWYASVWL